MSDYFVWETRRRDSEALIAGFPPTPQEYGVSFFVGRRFLVDLPELELVMDRAATGALTDDLVVAKQRCIAHSNRLQRVLRAVGVDGIDYYPVRIVNPITGDVYRSHEAANILEVIYCLDREGSDLDIDDEDPTNVWYINRLALAGDRLGDALMKYSVLPSLDHLGLSIHENSLANSVQFLRDVAPDAGTSASPCGGNAEGPVDTATPVDS